MRPNRPAHGNRAFLLVLLLTAGGLAGCSSVRQAAGVEKTPPDEFAVVTKAPLVIPPDFDLRPPKPGAAPTNQSSPTDSAQTALFGDDPATVAASLPDTYSSEEKAILADTGGATADHHIRAQIAADAKAMSTADDSFTDQLLFFETKDPNAGHPVNADAEHDRLVAEKTSGEAPTEGSDSDKKSSQEAASINKDSSDGQKSDSDDDGWFGGLFDDIF